MALDRTVLVGDRSVDLYDPEEAHAARLSIGLLGEEARAKWGCHGCGTIGCLAIVERYDEAGHGSSFALCEPCLWERLK